jgi:hypothetical protein
MFLFSLETSPFCGARQFVVPADEIFDIFGGFWATVAPSYMICENPRDRKFLLWYRTQSTLNHVCRSLRFDGKLANMKWLQKKKKKETAAKQKSASLAHRIGGWWQPSPNDSGDDNGW